jgi:hypothetical protein
MTTKNVEGAVAKGFNLVMVTDHTGTHRPIRVFVTKRPKLGTPINLRHNGKPVEAYHWPRHAAWNEVVKERYDVPDSTVFLAEGRYWCIQGWAAANTVKPSIETSHV